MGDGTFHLQKQQAPTESFNSERSSWPLSRVGGHRAQAGHSRVRDTVSSSTQGPPEWLPFFVSGCDGSQAGMGALPGELLGSCSRQGACQGYPLKPTLGSEQLRGPSPTISWELHHPQLLGWGQEAAWAPVISPQGFPAAPDPRPFHHLTHCCL